VLGWAVEGSNLQAGHTGVAVASLLADDLGDSAAARRLIGRWDRVRRCAGLAAPLGLGAPLADRFGLDPAAPPHPDPAYVWRPEPVEELVRAAQTLIARPLQGECPPVARFGGATG
jgi:hypothetical protein